MKVMISWRASKAHGYDVRRLLFMGYVLFSIIMTAEAFHQPVKATALFNSRGISIRGLKPIEKCNLQRYTVLAGSADDYDRFGDNFNELQYKRITPKQKRTFIGPNKDSSHTPNALLRYFVPGIVFIWAAGYSAVFFAETQGEGLGDVGGYVGAGLAVFLLFSLLGAAAYETFKPGDDSQ